MTPEWTLNQVAIDQWASENSDWLAKINPRADVLWREDPSRAIELYTRDLQRLQIRVDDAEKRLRHVQHALQRRLSFVACQISEKQTKPDHDQDAMGERSAVGSLHGGEWGRDRERIGLSVTLKGKFYFYTSDIWVACGRLFF